MLKGWISPRALGLTVAVGAMLAAVPAMAQSLTVSDIKLDDGLDVVMSLPTLSADGANLDEDAIRAIFSGEFDDADRAALSGLTASSIVIPELRLTPVPGSDEDDGRFVTITGIELNDVNNGLASTASIGEIAFNGGTSKADDADKKTDGEGEDEAEGPVDIVLTGLETTGFDIAHVLRLMMIATGGEEIAVDAEREEPRALFASLNLAGGSVTSEDGSCAIGTLTMDSFAMRPLRLAVEQETESPEQAAAREEANGVEALAALAMGPITLASLDCDGTDEQGGPLAITAGTTTIGGIADGKVGESSIDGLRIENKDEGWFELARAVLKPYDFTRWIDFYEAQRSGEDPGVFVKATQLDQFTSFDGFSVTGIGFDFPDEENPGSRIVGSVDEVDFTLLDYVDGVPGTVSERIAGIRFTIPQNEENAPVIAALGTDTINMDVLGDLHFDREGQTLVFDRFSLTVADLAKFGFNGSIGNFTDAVYSPDEETALRALMGLTIKDLQIDLLDDGGLDIFIATVAAEQGATPEQFRAGVAAMLQGTVIMGLGASPESMGVASALSNFVNTGGSISIKATAIDPEGVPVSAVAAAEDDPTALMKLFKIEAITPDAPASAGDQPGPAADAGEPDAKEAPEKSK
jgi:hypothetical protein